MLGFVYRNASRYACSRTASGCGSYQGVQIVIQQGRMKEGLFTKCRYMTEAVYSSCVRVENSQLGLSLQVPSYQGWPERCMRWEH